MSDEKDTFRNLYADFHLLWMTPASSSSDNPLDQAERRIAEVFAQEPDNRQALLSWVELRCRTGREEEALARLTPLLAAAPADPYYKLAYAFIRLWQTRDCGSQTREWYEFPLLLADARKHATSSWDALAKIALTYTRVGFWSLGLEVFVEAARLRLLYGYTVSSKLRNGIWRGLREPNDAVHILTDPQTLGEWLGAARALDKLPTLNAVQLGIAAKAACLLLAAYKLGIEEASLAFCHLACKHSELGEALTNRRILEVLATHCAPAFHHHELVGVIPENGNLTSH